MAESRLKRRNFQVAVRETLVKTEETGLAMAIPHDGNASNLGHPASGETFGQTVLVLQGGGALGAYQAGVYEALSEAGIEPDWVIGTSIGAINAALIAGNPPGERLAKLREFWNRIKAKPAGLFPGSAAFEIMAANLATVTRGVRGFFEPNPLACFGIHAPVGPENAAYYATAALETTLAELTTPACLNGNAPRLTVGAARVKTSEMVYFDSRSRRLTLKHVLASGALPPAFPAIRIDGDLYWDGGLLSNTPLEAVFDDSPRRNAVIFAVDIWNARGSEPGSIWEVLNRQKDLQFASRTETQIARQQQIHRLRHIIKEMSLRLPPNLLESSPELAGMAAYGCLTRMHVVKLLAPPLNGEDHLKDMDFSAAGIEARWAAGLARTRETLKGRPWTNPGDPLDGMILHEAVDAGPAAL